MMITNKNVLIIFAIIASGFFSCNNKNEDLVKTPNKDGSVETQIGIAQADGFQLLTTKHVVWVKGQEMRTIVRVDTLPSLGSELLNVEDEKGTEVNTIANKDYELYITIK
jgi:hypothetical protein